MRYCKQVNRRLVFRDTLNNEYDPFELQGTEVHYSTKDMIDPVKHDLEKVACVSLPTHPIFTKSLPSPQSMSRCQKLCLFLQLVQNPPNQNRPQKFSTQTAILSSHCQKQVKL